MSYDDNYNCAKVSQYRVMRCWRATQHVSSGYSYRDYIDTQQLGCDAIYTATHARNQVGGYLGSVEVWSGERPDTAWPQSHGLSQFTDVWPRNIGGTAAPFGRLLP